MKYKRDSKIIIERSVREFENQMTKFLSQDYYLIGSLVISKRIKSLIPFCLENEYCALLSRSVKIEDEEV